MPEVKVASWNALNAFGDERSHQALEVIKRLDSDILFIGEMTARGGLESDHFLEFADMMRVSGYNLSRFSNYSPPHLEQRDEHTMGVWVRDASSEAIHTPLLGNRYGMRLSIPAIDAVAYGVHLDDRHETTRLLAAKALLTDKSRLDASEGIILGDLNAMHRADTKSVIPRTLGRIIANLEVKDYYDSTKKLQRLGGKVLRICRMADGSTLRLLNDNGYDEADPEFTPTIGRGKLAFQIDHILTSNGLEVSSFRVHPRSANDSSPDISDHSPISATISR